MIYLVACFVAGFAFGLMLMHRERVFNEYKRNADERERRLDEWMRKHGGQP